MSMALMMSAMGALALTSGIALAAAQPHDMGDHPQGEVTRAEAVAMAARHFERMDINRDGKLDRADREAAHARMADGMFDRADANKDGMISRDEWNAGAAKLAEARGGHGGPHMRRMGFMADADRDGAITRAEFDKRALDHFERADANKDGKISAAEREQAHAAMREHFERR